MNASSSHLCALETNPYVSTPMEATGAGPIKDAIGAMNPMKTAQPVWVSGTLATFSSRRHVPCAGEWQGGTGGSEWAPGHSH